MRVAERADVVVVAVEIGFPLSLLAWRFALRHESPAMASELTPVHQLLPMLVIPIGILVWASLRRLRRGLPPWWWVLPALTVQLAITIYGEWVANTMTLTLIFACTALVILRSPWSWLVFGAAIGFGVVSNWTLPIPGMLGLVLHNLLVGLVIYAVVLMGELAVALRRAQDQLAGFAVVQERARVSRDLHDTLGQELTAIGLRSELAARLMTAQPDRAAAELRAVQEMTEHTLENVRQVAKGQWQPVFEDELTTGIALLESAGVRCRASVDGHPGEQAARVAGWALREGITNVLKHSSARTCLLNAEIRDGRFRLTIENDGVRRRHWAPGTGLAGISERVTSLGGRVRFGPAACGRFRLVVEIPIGEDD